MNPTLPTSAVAALLLAAVLPLPAQTTPIPEADLLRRLAATVDSLAANDAFSGVVALAHNGTLVFRQAWGMADREASRPNDPETAFNIGSINKVFTATAVRQLIAAGRLHPDSSVLSYWPDYPNPEVGRRITIGQLLQHTSGIGGNIFDPPAGGRRTDIRRLADFLPLFVQQPLRFEPGSQEAYSNAGYVVLGLLIERLSGKSYYDYISEHVYAPAGMGRTGHFAVDALPPNTAIGYTRGGSPGDATSPLHRNSAELPGRGSSAGGGYSTAGDLLRFLTALKAGVIPGGPPAGIGVAGGAGGLNAALEGDLPGGYDLVVLANLDPPAAERVARMVREWLGVRED